MAFPTLSQLPPPPERARSAASAARSGAARPSDAVRPRTLRPRDLLGRSAFAGASFERARALALTPLDEARALDARAFSGLPLGTVLELEVPGWSGPVWLRSRAGRGPEALAPTDPVIDGPAWDALVVAVASDRARPSDFRALVAHLAQLPANEPERDLVAVREIAAWMEGVAPESRPLRLGQVLERLGARLFSVRIEPSEPDEAAANGPAVAHAG